MKRQFLVLMTAVFCFASLCGAGVGQTPETQNPAPPATGAKDQSKKAMKAGDEAEAKHAYKEAVADFKKAVELDPDNQEAHEEFIQANFMSVYDRIDVESEKTEKKATKQKQAILTPEQKERQEKFAEEQEERRQRAADERMAAAKTKVSAKLLKTYDGWIKKNPQKAIFLWGKGEVLASSEKGDEAHEVYLKAIATDPSCAPAYEGLASVAALSGDVQKQRQYAEKALALDPKAASHTFSSYAMTYLSTDPARFRQLVEDRVAKYPDGSEMLLSLVAGNEESELGRQAVLEQIYKLYGENSPGRTMTELFSSYAKSDPTKALSFAEQMQKDHAEARAKAKGRNPASGKTPNQTKGKAKRPYWETVVDFEKGLIDARSLMAQGKYADAQALLEKHALHASGEFDAFSYVDRTPYELAEAEALAGGGDVQNAYDNLRAKLLPEPNEKLEAALMGYGTKLGKTPDQVNQDLWQTRESQAKKMEPFDLKDYTTDRQVKLADFRGRVVLVNFWFPA